MSLLGKKWPTPVGKPMAPFFAAGLIMLYGINSAATAMLGAEAKAKRNAENH